MNEELINDYEQMAKAQHENHFSADWATCTYAFCRRRYELIQQARNGALNTNSVLQDWVMDLPLREQGTLLTAVRGCDLAPKEWDETGSYVRETPERRLTAFIRFAFMKPADPREVDIPGAFFQSSPPKTLKVSALGHYPLHWYSHVMHALEVIGYRHPIDPVRQAALGCYLQLVKNLHLRHECYEDFYTRLSEDRIESGAVVS